MWPLGARAVIGFLLHLAAEEGARRPGPARCQRGDADVAGGAGSRGGRGRREGRDAEMVARAVSSRHLVDVGRTRREVQRDGRLAECVASSDASANAPMSGSNRTSDHHCNVCDTPVRVIGCVVCQLDRRWGGAGGVSAENWMARAAACAIAGVLLGGVCLIAQGPVPGDVSIARALQSALGATPAWAQVVTDTAKPPWLWATLAVAVALEYLRKGWWSAIGPALALLLAQALDALLRAVLFAPRPTAELVAIASPSSSSGLPSTFGLVYGALFGAAACLVSTRSNVSAAISVLAIVLVLVGACARVVLGGHWSSQIVASLLLGAAFAVASHRVLASTLGERRARR
ncbi:MAG: hypothetical protein DCC71_00805 [Proteobacteria bacterium]|nr:MAG: hypothetical protein DCC71_00805 [Pseudomonadota bacterium]